MLSDTKPALPRDLLPRVVSGVVLGVAALLLTWWSVWSFAVLVTAVALIVAWEWGRIVRKSDFDLILAINAIAVVAAVLLTLLDMPVLALLAVVVAALLAAVQGFSQLGRISALGVLYSGLPAIALVWFRGSPRLGLTAIFFLFAAVWGTDTGAYAAGRTLGGPKLMPRFSPNKTWSGLLGGVVTSAVLALLFTLFVHDLKPQWLIPVAMSLAVIAQVGDLMESALKRWYGVKDASGLIPGHGGFMDRVDGLVAVVVVAAVVAGVLNAVEPSRALLMGP